jgi:hypothetical protein
MEATNNGNLVNKDRKSVYALTERDGRTYWTRVGAGFVNKDGSITLRLDAMPISGQLQIREWESPEQRAENFRRRFANDAAA